MTPPAGPHHILIADDEELICVTVADFLRDAGHTVTIVHDGSEVMPVISKEEIDLVLLDVMMPQMNGLEALALIKKQSPDTRVIMLSGYGTEDKVREAEQLGADAFINKPFGVTKLMSYINAILGGSAPAAFHEPEIE